MTNGREWFFLRPLVKIKRFCLRSHQSRDIYSNDSYCDLWHVSITISGFQCNMRNADTLCYIQYPIPSTYVLMTLTALYVAIA